MVVDLLDCSEVIEFSGVKPVVLFDVEFFQDVPQRRQAQSFCWDQSVHSGGVESLPQTGRQRHIEWLQLKQRHSDMIHMSVCDPTQDLNSNSFVRCL